MTDRDKLVAMRACQSALDWIGARTIEQAWKDCQRADWMCWLLRKIAPDDPRCRLAGADFAERVWHLIPNEPTRLAAAWAIDAARRGDRDEMCAAGDATDAATYASASAAAASAAAFAAADADATAYAASAAERAAQADILRGYFSASEISDLFNRS